MAYPKGHTASVRQRIVRSARKLFNLRGFERVTINEVMSDAGLTRGAFYFHFRSKAQLFRESLAHVLVEHPSKMWIDSTERIRSPQAVQIIEAYLGSNHLAEVAESCPLVTHAAEAGRAGKEAQQVMETVLRALIGALSPGSQPVDDNEKIPEEGLVLAAICVGGLSLARSVNDPALANRLLSASRSAALRIFAGSNSGA